MPDKRTTVVAREEDLATLSDEARTRGLSLGRMLGEVVAQRAEELRQDKRPRLGTFRVETSIAAAAREEGPETSPFRAA
jgi:hypothetical protein